MSLRVFHVVFVAICVALSLFVAVWGVAEFSRESSVMALAVAVVFFGAAVALVIYGKKVFVKLRDLP